MPLSFRGLLDMVLALGDAILAPLKFIWHCFLRPLGATPPDQQTRLDKFYKGQADVYDKTRKGLLRGRVTMLRLSASHLRVLRAKDPSHRLVWIDIGGGTGYNIEEMDKHFPVSQFDAIYLIDLCEPLLEVARKRFVRNGWHNITVLCQDATEFSISEWSTTDPKGSISFITLSYSLSMIPNFYAVLDRVNYVLSPETGLLGVSDFYTSGHPLSLHEKAIGGVGKECGRFNRWFWQIWFDFDHVSLSPQRRDYLEYKFGTIKSYNGRNQFIIPYIVRIPYYIWLGRSRSCDASRFRHIFEVESGNTTGSCSPSLPNVTKNPRDSISEVEQPAPGNSTIDSTFPSSPFHYHIGYPWRLPYYEQPIHKKSRTLDYLFTWEDPFQDMKHLDLGPDDTMLVITSSGDNALHYAIAAQPRRIHCVDMNPCQGHLLELKLAASLTLDYDDFFALFGMGQHPRFHELLVSRISPLISSVAYQFWRINNIAFSKAFYLSGYGGSVIRFTRTVFTLAGVRKDAEELCNTSTRAEQAMIWKDKLVPILLNPLVIGLLKIPALWNAFGVTENQRKMLLDEGTVREFVRDTLVPIPSMSSFTDAYIYHLCLTGHYTPTSCPSYLTRAGFDKLRADNAKITNAFRLHTDSILSVLRGLSTGSLTRAVIMDHLDNFAPGSKDVDDEVCELGRVLSSGGFVLWRSVARQPWYQEVFRKHTFFVTPINIRNGTEVALDMVNMHASLWKAVRV